MDSLKKFADRSKEGLQKTANWAKTDGVVLAKTAGEKTKAGVSKSVKWAKTDGKEYARKGATTTGQGLVSAANWTAATGKKGVSRLKEKLSRAWVPFSDVNFGADWLNLF